MDDGEKYLQLTVTEQHLVLGALVQSRFECVARAAGLTPREARVLIYVGAAHARKQAALSADIARSSGLAASHVSQAVAQLNRRGLLIVPEVQDAGDRRLKRVYLSTEGKRALVRLQQRALDIEGSLRTSFRTFGRRSSNLDRANEAIRRLPVAE
jgi:DNA-binding MarR family transcriptional regulator